MNEPGRRAEVRPSAIHQPTSPDVSRIGVARPWRSVCHRATAGGWIRGVLEQYVAGSDTRGRPEGRSYPRSQQVIRETSGLGDLLRRIIETLST
jgi:hypothetical protein